MKQNLRDTGSRCKRSLRRDSVFYTPYTFSAKERDLETGYSYFGARYYNATLSVWLSVDPMSDKHPDVTHYAYCYNNPINLVDPKGLDTIMVHRRTGEMHRLERDIDHDVVIRVGGREFRNKEINYKRNGELRNRHRQPLRLDKRSFAFKEDQRQDLKSGEKFNFTQITLASEGRTKTGELLYNFLINNTRVEWSYSAYLSSPQTEDVQVLITSMHERLFDKSGSSLIMDQVDNHNALVISFIHNHTSGILNPSDQDKNFRQEFLNKGQDPIFAIMGRNNRINYLNKSD